MLQLVLFQGGKYVLIRGTRWTFTVAETNQLDRQGGELIFADIHLNGFRLSKTESRLRDGSLRCCRMACRASRCGATRPWSIHNLYRVMSEPKHSEAAAVRCSAIRYLIELERNVKGPSPVWTYP